MNPVSVMPELVSREQLTETSDSDVSSESESPVIQRGKMARIGSIDPFDSATDDWVEYTERISQYFMANDIGDDKHVAVLLSAMGGKSLWPVAQLNCPRKAFRQNIPATGGGNERTFIPKTTINC